MPFKYNGQRRTIRFGKFDLVLLRRPHLHDALPLLDDEGRPGRRVLDLAVGPREDLLRVLHDLHVLVVEGVGALAAPHALRVARGEAQAALRALVSGGAERPVDAVSDPSFGGVGQYFSDARRRPRQMVPELRDALLFGDAHAAEAL